jgi:class 3 adenylate cyclase
MITPPASARKTLAKANVPTCPNVGTSLRDWDVTVSSAAVLVIAPVMAASRSVAFISNSHRGGVRGTVVYVTSMSDSHSASREAQAIMRRLQHQMRTPLGQIIGYSEMLEEEVCDRGAEDLVPDLAKIRDAARTLLTYVDEYFRAEPAAAIEPAQQPGSQTQATAPAASEDRASETGGRILVVDDELHNRDMLSRRLRSRGFDVDTAESGEEALSAIWNERFDLVILDIMMPGMSGIEVLTAVRKEHSATDLPVIMATALDASETTAEALGEGANDYVTKPIDFRALLARMQNQLRLRRAMATIENFARQLKVRNAFIRKTFGRYVSDEIASDVLENPEGLEIRGEKRRVTILMADLRGFTSLTESLSPVEIVAILNNHLGKMAEIILAHRGTIDEFIGDAVLAFFGAPTSQDDDSERAVACAVQMQRAMEQVNAENHRQQLPDVEMGIGIASGDVVVGNIGSEHRTKYAAVGSTINLAARVESYTLGGEIIVDAATFESIGAIARAEPAREVQPKGFEQPIRIHPIVGLGGRYDLDVPRHTSPLVDLEEEIAVAFSLLEGKHISRDAHRGAVCSLSETTAVIRSADPVQELANLRIDVLDAGGAGPRGSCYAKVVTVSEQDGAFVVRFTSNAEALTAIQKDRR